MVVDLERLPAAAIRARASPRVTSPAAVYAGHVADSGAVRQQRYKAHRRGDHHLCKRDCQRGPLYPVPAEVQAAFPARSQAVTEFDPVLALRDLAARLEGVHVADPSNAAIARELRATLLAIPGDGGEDDPLAELFASMPPS